MYILGISALYHDAAAAIIQDGCIIAAAQEERFTRIKHDSSFPINAIQFCLNKAGILASQLSAVCYYDMPFLALDRYIQNIAAAGEDAAALLETGFPKMFSEHIWIREKIKNTLAIDGNKIPVYTCEHHISHGASAFYPSPFEQAIIITIDGVGEWATTTIGVGCKNQIEIKEQIKYPHSLGLLYSSFTYFCGFKVNSGDYKFMGLAPYGEPIYERLIREKIIDIKEDGSFRLNLKYFDFQYGRAMTNKEFEKLFGGERRTPESIITKREMDIAASVQRIVEDIIVKIASHAKKTFGIGIDNLVLAGGVALNCVANGKLYKSQIFKNIWIQPAAGDAGGSLGCALFCYYQILNNQRKVLTTDSMQGSFLGPGYTDEYMIDFLTNNQYAFHHFSNEEIYEEIAKRLVEQKVIGIFQGRMEFGPRALGDRSIIADARSEKMQVILNKKIKFRESFRPFAPSVLQEDVANYFEVEDGYHSPYMLLVDKVKSERCLHMDVTEELKKSDGDMLSVVKQKRSDLPAITHVDYSARIQTVSPETNLFYYNIIKAFKNLTGCGVIVNTSFNVRGEPIVCTPEEAYACFMRSDMDILVLENCVLYKHEQSEWSEPDDWRQQFKLD